MYRTAICLNLIFLITLVINHSVNGQIVYDNGAGGAAGIDDAFSSDTDTDIYGADDFSLLANISITGVEWTGVYAFDGTPPPTDDFTINIHSDNGGSPGSILSSTPSGNAVNRTDSGVDIIGYDIYDYSAPITPFPITPGTTYWLSIFGDTAGEDDDWLWGIDLGAGNSQISNDLGATWSAANHRMDFRLISAVPEPTSFGIIGLTIGAFAIRRRRS